MIMAPPLLEVENLSKWFPVEGGLLKAVTDVSFAVKKGEVLGIVGESGSGKSTVGQTVLRLTEPNGGDIRLNGTSIAEISQSKLRPMRRKMQMVFQDPSASLNPHLRVGQVLMEPLKIHGIGKSREGREARAIQLLNLVGLSADYFDRFPHELSGGQRQRVGIARALACEPELLIADEPVSALDVSIQAQVLALIEGLKKELSLTLVIISHDMSVVEYMSDRVIVLYLGRVMECGPAATMFAKPRHPYTEALLSAIPGGELENEKRQRIVLSGDPPSPISPPSGCPFRTRCRYAVEACAGAGMQLVSVGESHQTACIRAAELNLGEEGVKEVV